MTLFLAPFTLTVYLSASRLKPRRLSLTSNNRWTSGLSSKNTTCIWNLLHRVPPPLGWPGLGQVGSGADRLPASFAQGASEFGTLTRFGEVPFLSGRVRSGLHQPGLPSHCFSQVSGLHLVLSGWSQVMSRWILVPFESIFKSQSGDNEGL